MPKIKLTKSELKTQRDSLKQFSRFLPTLLLKKQQLQMEMMKCQQALSENESREKDIMKALRPWISLFGSTAEKEKILELISLKQIVTRRRNIAGVDVPVYESVEFDLPRYDLFIEPLWFDAAIEAIRKLIEIRSEKDIIMEQLKLIGQELRVTTQRVNLFEKVKIPECRENIRVIQIYLGDQQTAAVGRSKIAKRKMQEVAI